MRHQLDGRVETDALDEMPRERRAAGVENRRHLHALGGEERLGGADRADEREHLGAARRARAIAAGGVGAGQAADVEDVAFGHPRLGRGRQADVVGEAFGEPQRPAGEDARPLRRIAPNRPAEGREQLVPGFVQERGAAVGDARDGMNTAARPDACATNRWADVVGDLLVGHRLPRVTPDDSPQRRDAGVEAREQRGLVRVRHRRGRREQDDVLALATLAGRGEIRDAPGVVGRPNRAPPAAVTAAPARPLSRL